MDTTSTLSRRLLALCGCCLLLLTACVTESGSTTLQRDDGTSRPPTQPLASTTTFSPTSPSTTGQIEATEGASGFVSQISVLEDQPYYESDDGTTFHLDAYYPNQGRNRPLVVLFHGNPVFGSTKESVRALATMITERGAVVVAPTWGRQMSMGDMTAIAGELGTWVREQGPCAVWRAADLADFTGADGSHVILVGEAAGVLPAQAVTFAGATQVTGCLSPASSIPVERAILFDSDWMLVPSIWDEVLIEDPELLAMSSFWDRIDDPNWTRVTMLVGEDTAPETVRSLEGDTYREAHWIRIRDPEGRYAEAFAASGTLEDGSMSFTDVTRVVVTLMEQRGWDVELLTVPGAGHALISQAARAFVTDLIFSE